MWGMVSRGDFGYSFSYNRPVASIIGQYMGLTLIVSLVSMLFTYVVFRYQSAFTVRLSNIPSAIT
jgi:peptide/nickel transport system permease protein